MTKLAQELLFCVLFGALAVLFGAGMMLDAHEVDAAIIDWKASVGLGPSR